VTVELYGTVGRASCAWALAANAIVANNATWRRTGGIRNLV
jgi:hypothetical protein